MNADKQDLNLKKTIKRRKGGGNLRKSEKICVLLKRI